MAEKMLTPEEVAERLAVTPNTVRGWLRDGTLRGVKLGKKVWRIREEDLLNCICLEQEAEYRTEELDETLNQDDLQAIKQGIEDIKAGRYIAREEYEKGKRP